MPEWKQEIRHRLAELKLEPTREAEIVDELAQHLEDRYAELRAGGEAKEAAYRAALAELSESEILARELRRVEPQVTPEPIVFGTNRRTNMIADLWQDLRYGARMLVKKPGFTLIAVVTLALGIGANTAIFSLVNTILLRPLPVREPQRLVSIFPTILRTGEAQIFSYPNYVDVRDRNDVFTDLAAFTFAGMSLSRNGNNEIIYGYLASGNYFELLGVNAALGRTFTPKDDRTPNADPVAVLSYASWQKRFGADHNIVGQTVLLNNLSYTIIGVAPPRFNGTEFIYAPEMWVPMMMLGQIKPGSKELEQRNINSIYCVGRLKPGVSAAQAESALTNVMAQLGREFPDSNEGKGMMLTPPGLVFPTARTGFIGFAGVLMLTVALVLLIACTNLAGLLLARAAGRRKEIAIRLALGASRARLVRQLLTESVLLALAGGVVGVLLAVWLIDLVMAFKPPISLPLLIDLQLDWRVLSFTVVLSLLTGTLFGLLPALQATKPELVPALKDESALGGYRRSRLRNTLVVAQVALSLVLLVAAGLVQVMSPGFNPENVVALTMVPSLQGYDEAKGKQLQQQLIDRVSNLPGVKAMAITNRLPLSLSGSDSYVFIEGAPPTSSAQTPNALNSNVSPGYFQTMEIPLVAGRVFTERDREDAPRVVVINETFARRFWPGQDAIGKRFRYSRADGPLVEVAGVVKDGKYFSLGEDPKPFFYLPLLQSYEEPTTLIARTTNNPSAALATIRDEILKLDPTMPFAEVKTLTEHMSLSLFPLRIGASVVGSFGLLALLLAAIGIYGVMAFAVSQRTREIGIRMALGAQGADVLRLIIRQGLTLMLIGLGLGLAGALLLTRLMSSVLYGVSATDAVTFVSVTALLFVVVLIACWVPARRATNVDPIAALRCE
jgi:predicted permease